MVSLTMHASFAMYTSPMNTRCHRWYLHDMLHSEHNGPLTKGLQICLGMLRAPEHTRQATPDNRMSLTCCARLMQSAG